MEPAVERREHLVLDQGADATVIGPQWSPPVKGRSTALGHRQQHLVQVAAMEPACERREHIEINTRPAWLIEAEMEPAGERREQANPDRWPSIAPTYCNGARRRLAGAPTGTGVGEPQGFLPQSRPPSDGGGTSARLRAPDVVVAAAMEPAFDRREQSRHAGPSRSACRYRNGAAAERREHATVDVLRIRIAVAAMEPAARWREHLSRENKMWSAWSPQWSPPLISGST